MMHIRAMRGEGIRMELVKGDYNHQLGICIPTYNRASKLRQALDTWIPIIAKYDIPIFISDNASSDDTENVVVERRKEYPHIFYCKNEENIGPDKNFEKVLKFADTKYRWLMGDDDVIVRGEISEILRHVEEDHDLLLVNYPLYRPYTVDVKYTDMNALLSDFGAMLTCMSAFVFHEKVVCSDTFTEAYNSDFSRINFAHLGATFCCLGDGHEHSVYFISSVGIDTIRVGLYSWLPLAMQYFINNLSATVSLLPGLYAESSRKKCCRDVLNVCWGWKGTRFYVYHAKKGKQLSVRWYFRSRKNLKVVFDFRQRTLIFFTALLPRFLVSVVWTMGSKINKQRRLRRERRAQTKMKGA